MLKMRAHAVDPYSKQCSWIRLKQHRRCFKQLTFFSAVQTAHREKEGAGAGADVCATTTSAAYVTRLREGRPPVEYGKSTTYCAHVRRGPKGGGCERKKKKKKMKKRKTCVVSEAPFWS